MRFTDTQLIEIYNKLANEGRSGIFTEELCLESTEVIPGITEDDIRGFMDTFNEADRAGLVEREPVTDGFYDQEYEADFGGEELTTTCFNTVIAKYDAEAVRKALTEPMVKTTRKPVYKSDLAEEKYLHLSDLHIPFQIDEVNAIIDSYANKNYNLIINGDFLDCHDISTFPKSKAVGLNNEVKMAADLLKEWSLKFKKIYLISGNHEKRMASYIRKRISPEVVQLVEDDILAYIVNSLKLPNLIYNPGDTTNWYVQIDNVVCCHPDDYKGSTTGMLQTATHALGYFETYNKNVDIVLLGHTHHLGIGVFKNKVVAESGCLCQPQDYAASGRLNYKPQANGFIEFTSRNGKVTFNDVQLRFIDESD